MYTYNHLEKNPKKVRIEDLTLHAGDAFQVVSTGVKYLITYVERRSFQVFDLEGKVSWNFDRDSKTEVILLDVTITTAYSRK